MQRINFSGRFKRLGIVGILLPESMLGQGFVNPVKNFLLLAIQTSSFTNDAYSICHACYWSRSCCGSLVTSLQVRITNSHKLNCLSFVELWSLESNFSAFKAATVSQQSKKFDSDIMYIGPAYLSTSILAFDGFKESTLAHIYHLKRIKWVKIYRGATLVWNIQIWIQAINKTAYFCHIPSLGHHFQSGFANFLHLHESSRNIYGLCFGCGHYRDKRCRKS